MLDPGKYTTRILIAVGTMALLTTACGTDTESAEDAAASPADTSTEESGETSPADGEDATVAESQDLREVSVRVDWTPLGYHSPFLVAEELGYYAEEGLTVKVGEGKGSVTAAQVVATGQDEFGWVDLASVMPLMAEGAPIKAVAVVAQRPTTFVAALEENGITEPSDLIGKVIGTTGGGATTQLIPPFLEAAGVDPDDVDELSFSAAAKTQALVNGRVDAIIANTTAQLPQFEEMGVDVSSIMLGDYVNLLSYSIVANGSILDEEPEVVEGFVRATLRAWDWAVDNPEEAVEMLAEEFQGVDTAVALRQLEEVFPLFHTERTEGLELGRPDTDDILETEQLLNESGVLDTATGDSATYFSDVAFK